MARGVRNKAQLGTYYRTATGPRSVPLTDPQGHRLRWPIDIGGVHVYSRDAESVIFVPSSRFWIENEADDPDALWREDTEAFDCFKTSYAYNMIGQEHPRIVPVIGQDAWTGLPILKKPSYGSLWTFIQNYGSQVYTAQADAAPPTSRIKPELRPLAYQWSLQLLSGLSLIHSRGIAYGELIETNCWISAGSLSIAVAGFLGSDFTDPSNGWNFPGSFFSGIEFSPEYLPLSRAVRVPTSKTDMFMFGRLVYQIMTSELPGDGIGSDWGETERLMAEEDWMPDLEDEFMGKIVHKCWRLEYEDVEELQSEVQAFVEAHGWSIRGDELEGFDAHSIHRELEANFVPEDDE
ncbi:hypothetical protein FOQG_10131 [Fusarium oxysporum f. sp. raphani 54005]|uniref:Protein kinase domain-containing protein n=2 Tax=Fusarium oxysporum f. sp. raphani TaxID=96318 RepID=X0CUB7_FUSOX|nr:hypothetical protein FOQG_10131 [Fusarium oxysporum f. sp. raphani 54005]KAG7411571.1 hypothetical protein Forpi1262_v017404 [Fusarium oxysporum f. sp. raphani]